MLKLNWIEAKNSHFEVNLIDLLKDDKNKV